MSAQVTELKMSGMTCCNCVRHVTEALRSVPGVEVQAGPGSDFYRAAWRQLKRGSSNMDTLEALGSTTAFAYSSWLLFSRAPGYLYFMEAAAIITIISIGHWVEARVSLRASGA